MTENKQPTAAELEVLQVLWKKGSATVKDVHHVICNKKDVGYTTTLKIMQNMVAKNLVTREQSGKSHIYYAAIKQKEAQRKLLDKFLDTAFSGSASSLVMQLLGNKKTSKEELKKIKDLVYKLEKEK